MCASLEPKINPPSKFVLGTIVSRLEEHIKTADLRFNVSVGLLDGFQLSHLHLPLPSPRKTAVTSAQPTLKPATCTAPTRL